MVKDIFREMKRKWFQFVAIAIITALGVGFLVGIQVTGYDMRQTGDAYILDANIMDLQMINTLGIDQEMVEEISKLIDADINPIKSYDAFVKTKELDAVVHFIEYDEHSQEDLSLISGRFPQNENEVVVDNQLFLQEKVFLNDEVRIVSNDQVDEGSVKVVGFVDSSLYFNLERGQSRLGSGAISGFMYVDGSFLKEDVYTSLRIVSEDVEGAKAMIKENEQTLIDNRFDRLIAPEILKLEDAQSELDQGRIDANNEFAVQWRKIIQSENELKDHKEEVSLGIAEISQSSFEGSLTEQLSQARSYSNDFFDLSIEELRIKRDEILALPLPDESLREPLIAEVDAGLLKLETGKLEVVAAYDLMETAISEIESGEIQLANGKSTYYAEKARIEQELVDNQKKIDDGYQEIEDTSHGSMFILNRSESVIGFDDFYQDSERIEQIGKVFPLIFFGVAILVTLSTITRMVDESRMQIGIYKALGYSWFRTSMKFVGFTFFAWLLGSLTGLFIGFLFIPELIYQAYQIMYLTPTLVGGFVWSYAWLPLIVSFVSSVGVALFKSQAVARETASLLLVPPVPKGGQRILLERIGFLWSRLSFLYKVSLRNLFRNKTRFLMTVVGIGGCCGLLLTGFGLRHSIYSIVDKQFDDIINYDGVVAYQSDWKVPEGLFTDFANVHTENGSVGGLDVSIYAAENLVDLSHIIRMHDFETEEPISVNENSIIVTQKLADYNNLGVGDEISVKVDSNIYSFVIGDITENYIGHYIYLSKTQYDSIVSKQTDLNLSLFQYAGSGDYLSETLLKDENVLSVSLLGNLKNNYSSMMGNFDIVIIVIAGAAFALELIVLLNLITMNMSERSKELATLKVLGFYPKELSSYIMRENIILTLLSLGVGVIFGKYLHNFVVVSAEINLVMFNREILLSTYLISVILTFGLAVIINLVMSRRANRVNMAEALKM